MMDTHPSLPSPKKVAITFLRLVLSVKLIIIIFEKIKNPIKCLQISIPIHPNRKD